MVSTRRLMAPAIRRVTAASGAALPPTAPVNNARPTGAMCVYRSCSPCPRSPKCHLGANQPHKEQLVTVYVPGSALQSCRSRSNARRLISFKLGGWRACGREASTGVTGQDTHR
jgi:hypothetical protein